MCVNFFIKKIDEKILEGNQMRKEADEGNCSSKMWSKYSTAC